MEKHMDVLSASNEFKQNRISNTNEKLKGESFGDIFQKVMSNKNIDSLKVKSIHLANPAEDIAAIKERKRIDDAIERLAGFFGIGKHLMAAILQSLKIDSKDLLDPSKREDILKALAKKFGLSKEKTEALLRLMDSF